MNFNAGNINVGRDMNVGNTVYHTEGLSIENIHKINELEAKLSVAMKNNDKDLAKTIIDSIMTISKKVGEVLVRKYFG